VVKTQKVEIEAEEDEKKENKSEHHGEHADVNASYSVTCTEPLKGKRVTISVMDLFPSIKTVSFQALTPTGQTEKKVQAANEFVPLP
jgi:hypothetical protein